MVKVKSGDIGLVMGFLRDAYEAIYDTFSGENYRKVEKLGYKVMVEKLGENVR